MNETRLGINFRTRIDCNAKINSRSTCQTKDAIFFRWKDAPKTMPGKIIVVPQDLQPWEIQKGESKNHNTCKGFRRKGLTLSDIRHQCIRSTKRTSVSVTLSVRFSFPLENIEFGSFGQSASNEEIQLRRGKRCMLCTPYKRNRN